MSLSHVGTAKGPDFERLRYFLQHFPSKRIIAAGGVRGTRDLQDLDAMGIDAVLLATALHTGEITAAMLRELGY